MIWFVIAMKHVILLTASREIKDLVKQVQPVKKQMECAVMELFLLDVLIQEQIQKFAGVWNAEPH